MAAAYVTAGWNLKLHNPNCFTESVTTQHTLPAVCTAIKIKAGFRTHSFHRHSLRPFHLVQHSESQALAKKIVKTCLLNLVTPFLTLMLTQLKDPSIFTNGLAIHMPFFLAILPTTPQVSNSYLLCYVRRKFKVDKNFEKCHTWITLSDQVLTYWFDLPTISFLHILLCHGIYEIIFSLLIRLSLSLSLKKIILGLILFFFLYEYYLKVLFTQGK